GRCVSPSGCRRRGCGIPSCAGRQVRPLLDDPSRSRHEQPRRSLQSLQRRGGRMNLNWRNFAPRDWGFVTAMIALILDQGSKLLMLHTFGFNEMRIGDSVPVLPFFNLVMVWNPGVSYGLFPARGLIGTLLLGLFSAVAVA